MLTQDWLRPRVEAIVQQHIDHIFAMWRRNRALYDLVGVLCVEPERWSLSMSRREAKLREEPSLVQHLPQVSLPAWAASPRLVPGTAMWLIVGAPHWAWSCLRIQQALTVHNAARSRSGEADSQCTADCEACIS